MYKTLMKKAEAEYIVKKSRFIGFAAPADDAEAALKLLDDIKKRHRSASHNCFAYVIGKNQGIIRYSDDGEPSGTAGKPIAEVLLARETVNCLVVVTRYFGGVLLGAGGLVRAYTHTAALALDAAGICTMHETKRLHLSVIYPLWNKVDHALQSLPVQNENTDYTQHVTASILCRTDDLEHVKQALMQTTDGKIGMEEDETVFYYPWQK